MALALETYRLSERFPKSEIYGLTSQIRRCAVSIPSNIAEGCGRATKRDFASFVVIARGSSYELETQTQLAIRLGYISEEESYEALKLTIEVGKLLRGLLSFLKADPPEPETRDYKQGNDL